MAKTLAAKLIEDHLQDGEMTPGEEIAIRIDQTLTQDATGTMVMLELEAMELDRAKTELSAQYVDHNLIQEDHKNPDDHRFLFSAAQRFGLWYSPPGNGISHAVHMQRFGIPGKSLLGSDSHTPAAGSLAMLAIGAGGINVAMAIAGQPFRLPMPEIWGIKLTGALSDWVSAKDVILEMLRRHGTDGARNRILEYYGPGVENLSAMDRHVICNMGAELGATTSVFPSDGETRRFMESCGRGDDWQALAADDGCEYDLTDELDLGTVVPLIAKPSSPGNVVEVNEVSGEDIYQSYIGSSANPGYRDFAVCADMVAGRTIANDVSFDINPTTRSLLEMLITDGRLGHLIQAGARLHQAGCNGCIGMGQAPASGQNSLRTTPRNFPDRSGTKDDAVWLCSPETATASALAGRIVDPREWAGGAGLDYPRIPSPDRIPLRGDNVIAPLNESQAKDVDLIKGPNVKSLPEFEELPDSLELPILLKVGDYVTTDEIMPAGAEVLPFRSNIPKIAEHVFSVCDESYVERARDTGDHAVVAGRDYGQGSSREHAALAPRYLGLRAVVAKSFARIAWQNLVAFGVLPLRCENEDDLDRLEQGKTLKLDNLQAAMESGEDIRATVDGEDIDISHDLSPRQREKILLGGAINWLKKEKLD